jgi:hypothetical protein
MPYVIRPRGVRRAIGALVGAAALISLLMPAGARAAWTCPAKETTQPFERFGDSADYFLAPNGGLEEGDDGWSLSKSSVVKGNEPFLVGSRYDRRSLSISRGGRALSPWFCVGQEHPTFRFFARQPQGAGSPDMKVSIRYITEDYRSSRDIHVDTYTGEDWRAWKPSRIINLYSNLGFSDPSSITAARVVFEAENQSGKPWQVDDLYVDPYRKR